MVRLAGGRQRPLTTVVEFATHEVGHSDTQRSATSPNRGPDRRLYHRPNPGFAAGGPRFGPDHLGSAQPPTGSGTRSP
jgi:hypothetical protein